MSKVKLFNYSAGIVGCVVLFLGATTDLIDAVAMLLFPLVLLVLFCSFIASVRSKQKRHVVIAGTLIIVFLLFSFLPFYGNHAGESGGGVHCHNIWELGHVH
jgi:formate hydrogenlyase subunit 3/multisubunit Na+/H+ antiporter MnhD subunit